MDTMTNPKYFVIIVTIVPIVTTVSYRRARARYPLPMYGIFVAITVMNCTFASSGRLAM
jgi:hypothetical protein